MTRSAAVAILSTCLTFMWTGPSYGQTRGARTSTGSTDSSKGDVARAKKIADMDAWLRRLVGRFDVVAKPPKPPPTDVCLGYSDNHPGAACVHRDDPGFRALEYIGLAECRFVDAPHGVSCLYTWRGFYWPHSEVLPTMLLVGIDPDNLAVRLLQVNHEGMATPARGQLKGNVAKLARECAGRDCLPMTWFINARTGERPVEILIEGSARMKVADKASVNADMLMWLTPPKRRD